MVLEPCYLPLPSTGRYFSRPLNSASAASHAFLGAIGYLDDWSFPIALLVGGGIGFAVVWALTRHTRRVAHEQAAELSEVARREDSGITLEKCRQALGALLVRATGRSITDYMQEFLYEPLGMEDDGFWLQALRKPNVELVRTGVDHIEADAWDRLLASQDAPTPFMQHAYLQALQASGSATAEAVLLAMSVTKRPNKVVCSSSVHPEYRRIIETYFESIGGQLVTVEAPGGKTSPERLAEAGAAADPRPARGRLRDLRRRDRRTQRQAGRCHARASPRTGRDARPGRDPRP